jgi:hypothetical protein
LSAVNVAETILVFAGAPLAVIAVLALLIYRPGKRTRSRYKSGQPWEHEPVWYEPHPEHGPGEHGPAGGGHGETQAIGSSLYGEPTGEDGHAAGHGASAHGASAVSRPVAAGPLGGARGTW